MQELRKLAPQAFMHDIGGYRLRAIYYEVFTDEAAQYIQAGGYRLLHDFSSHSGTGGLPADCRPRMLRLTRADMPPGAMSFAAQMFDPPHARLALTPAEQRVALHALQGASDRTVAETLGLSTETVRTNWRSIYRRMAPVLALADAPGLAGDDETRGREKRRFALEYLRQNMQELRRRCAPARDGHTTLPESRARANRRLRLASVRQRARDAAHELRCSVRRTHLV